MDNKLIERLRTEVALAEISADEDRMQLALDAIQALEFKQADSTNLKISIVNMDDYITEIEAKYAILRKALEEIEGKRDIIGWWPASNDAKKALEKADENITT